MKLNWESCTCTSQHLQQAPKVNKTHLTSQEDWPYCLAPCRSTLSLETADEHSPQLQGRGLITALTTTLVNWIASFRWPEWAEVSHPHTHLQQQQPRLIAQPTALLRVLVLVLIFFFPPMPLYNKEFNSACSRHVFLPRVEGTQCFGRSIFYVEG